MAMSVSIVGPRRWRACDGRRHPDAHSRRRQHDPGTVSASVRLIHAESDDPALLDLGKDPGSRTVVSRAMTC